MQPKITFPKTHDIEQISNAVVLAAEKMGAAYDKDAIDKTLTVLKAPFEAGSTAYRTTTGPIQDINFRYINLWVPFYPFDVAVENGLIKKNGHPCLDIIPTAMDHFGLIPNKTGFFGVDAGAATGLEKIWLFFPNSVPLEKVLQMPGVPDGIAAHLDFFKKYQHQMVRLFGVDFRSKTINLYFMAWEIGGLTPQKCAGMLGDLGLNVPNDEMLQHCARAVPLYYTFNWESPEVQRLCFACFAPKPALVPKWDPVIEKFVATAPTLAQQRLFYYNPTFSRKGDYTKIEIGLDELYSDGLSQLIPRAFLEKQFPT
ncbi:MAG: hypothetical protein JW953_04280 [Anaerolineae bacterium]|nr:hypothetical protein [Anaerolineae bacterium]